MVKMKKKYKEGDENEDSENKDSGEDMQVWHLTKAVTNYKWLQHLY